MTLLAITHINTPSQTTFSSHFSPQITTVIFTT